MPWCPLPTPTDGVRGSPTHTNGIRGSLTHINGIRGSPTHNNRARGCHGVLCPPPLMGSGGSHSPTNGARGCHGVLCPPPLMGSGGPPPTLMGSGGVMVSSAHPHYWAQGVPHPHRCARGVSVFPPPRAAPPRTVPLLRLRSTRLKVCGVLSPLPGITRQMSVTPSASWPRSAARRYDRKQRGAPGPPALRLAQRLYGVVSTRRKPARGASRPSQCTLRGG